MECGPLPFHKEGALALPSSTSCRDGDGGESGEPCMCFIFSSSRWNLNVKCITSRTTQVGESNNTSPRKEGREGFWHRIFANTFSLLNLEWNTRESGCRVTYKGYFYLAIPTHPSPPYIWARIIVSFVIDSVCSAQFLWPSLTVILMLRSFVICYLSLLLYSGILRAAYAFFFSFFLNVKPDSKRKPDSRKGYWLP